MKFLILFACAVAAASAGHIASVVPVVHAPQHLPVIGADGVPVDTAEVQHARAAHLVHKAEAHARNGDVAVVAAPVVAHAAPVVAHAAPVVAHAAPVVAHPAIPAIHTPVVATHGHLVQPAAYPTTAVHPTSVNGVPLETPEVVAAKTNHFAAHAEALARTGHVAVDPVHHQLHHLYRRGVYAPYAYSAVNAYPHVNAYSAYPHYY